MSVSYINETINELQISGLQIFYDFNSYSGSNVIRSIESGNASYSGEIVNYSTDFTGQSSGSGFFNGQYIDVKNTTGITSESFTIIFSQEKTGASPGVVFSTLDPGGPSGCEVGITKSNKLYYKNYIAGTPSYKTLDDYLYDKNICGISVNGEGSVSLFRLNVGREREKPFIYSFNNPTNTNPDAPDNIEQNLREYDLNTTTALVPSYSISNGSSLTIGSGEYPYKGFMDSFLYFDEEIGTEGLSQIIQSIYSEKHIVPAATGLVSGEITGYAVTAAPASGEVGTPFYISGSGQPSGFYSYPSGTPLTGAVGISGVVYVPQSSVPDISGTNQAAAEIYKKVTNLTLSFSLFGAPVPSELSDYYSSGSYWTFSGNSGTFNGSSALGAAGTIFGITGFHVETVTGYRTGLSHSLLGHSGNSGVLYSGFSYSGLRAPNLTYTGSGSYISGNSFGVNGVESYYPDAISAIGNIDKNFFYDVVYDMSQANGINNYAEPTNNSTYGKNSFFMTGVGGMHQTNVAINGVSDFTGQIETSTNQFNIPNLQVISGFAVTGTQVFTSLDLFLYDEIIYDIGSSGNRDALTIDSLSDYTSSPFASFDFESKTVFFNGVKLYSGIDYVYDGGFYPSGNVTGATGVYFTYLDYPGQSTQTGSGQNLITVNHDSITPNAYALFFNGIRRTEQDIIEHARYSDLISGTDVVDASIQVYSTTYQRI